MKSHSKKKPHPQHTLVALGGVEEFRTAMYNKAEQLRRSANDYNAVIRISSEIKEMLK